MIRGSEDSEDLSGGPRSFRIAVRILAGDKGYIDQSTSEDFKYDALDADVRLTVNGTPPFPSGAHRVSEDGFVSAIPVIDFLWHLAAAVMRLASGDTHHESVTLTSTDYHLDFLKDNGRVTVRVLAESSEGEFELLAETSVPSDEVIQACTRAAELVLLGVTSANPELEGNADLQRFAATVRKLRGAG